MALEALQRWGGTTARYGEVTGPPLFLQAPRLLSPWPEWCFAQRVSSCLKAKRLQ